ncbi:class I poly(R)-hydroxyalkanoic acid synthase [Paracoccus sp. MC1862]|nr:class I poly(R)-hydroxyalkanoic acid synthase [Paracoccus sp. MC1862]QQO46340.1 class I poly(R)-hydroxyalkanoic acid synthase [Paracoccus sp. MC1862]
MSGTLPAVENDSAPPAGKRTRRKATAPDGSKAEAASASRPRGRPRKIAGNAAEPAVAAKAAEVADAEAGAEKTAAPQDQAARRGEAPATPAADVTPATEQEPVTVTDEGLPAQPATATEPPRPEAPPPAAPAPETTPAPEVASASEVAPASATAFGNPLLAPGLSEKLSENISRIENLSQRLLRAASSRPMRHPGVEVPGPELYGSVAQAWLKLATEQPARLIEQQVRYWGDTLRHVADAQSAFVQGFQAPESDGPVDRRFKNPLWQTNPFYSFVMRQYQINAEAIRKAAADLDIQSDVERRRVDWFTRQMIDMLAPTNFLATNPDALIKALETEGESLVRGLENLVHDIEASGGEMIVSLADRSAFRVGENIGTTPGEVVHRTRMYELIQYAPTTGQVHKAPVVVFPPWINKYYILDLKPQNSMLRWLVEQGHTVFVLSWKNPDSSFADVAMDDYVAAFLETIDKVLELTEEPQLNAVGYCIGGTTLSTTLGVMKQRGDDRVKSATFFTTLTDFSDQGEFTTFLQDDFVGGIEGEVERMGYLSAKLMQRTFSFLRANDLIWGPAIRSYMLGETPPAFDLLYWNGDGTNLPGPMVTQYLREICQKNALVRDGFEVLGHKVDLSDVTVPLCAIACEGDHIAPWLHSWKGIAQMGAEDRTFILSESGHIAGIINPPSKVKYGHYLSHAGFDGTPEEWREHATYTPGSWWNHWGEWLAEHAGPMVPARSPQLSLAPAPGTYVHETA